MSHCHSVGTSDLAPVNAGACGVQLLRQFGLHNMHLYKTGKINEQGLRNGGMYPFLDSLEAAILSGLVRYGARVEHADRQVSLSVMTHRGHAQHCQVA